LQLPAREARAEDNATVVMARDRFAEGVEFFDAGRYEEARAAFLQAYALKAHPALLLNIAQSELRAGRFADAASHFSEYLATAEGTSAERESARRGFEVARAEVAELRLAIDAPGAELYLDDENVGQAPLGRPLFVAPGPHRLRARREDRAAEARITARPAATQTVDLQLLPVQATVALRPIVDPTTEAPSVTPPREDVGFGEWLLTTPPGLAGLILTGAGLALGTTGVIVASERYGEARDTSDRISSTAAAGGQTGVLCEGGSSPVAEFQGACSDRQNQLDQGDTWRALAIGGFVGAAAAATGTVLYYVLDAPGAAPGDVARRSAPTRSARPRLVPWLSGGARGLSVVGAF
jgi:tetratricopeptide (TPR) repeat protein